MTSCAVFAFVTLLFFGYFIYRIIRRGNELKQLVRDGVETTGTVTRQLRFGASRPQLYVRYEYRDGGGGLHTHKSNVPPEFWDAHPEGSPISIVYSRSRPALSAPLPVVEKAREALRKPSVPSAN